MEVEALPSSVDTKLPAGEDCSDELELCKIISNGSLAFDDWTSLISEIENKCPDNIEKLSLVYDSFLSEFPLCHEFWRKYADHKMRLCGVDKVVDVFEQAVLSATYSVDVWVDYCQYAISVYKDPDDIRRLFKRGISFVGKDYICHSLWDKYIEFEFSQQNWSSLANIYLQTLRFPTKKLQHYYDSFKKLVSIWEEEIKCPAMESKEEAELDSVLEKPYVDRDIAKIIKELQDKSDMCIWSTALQKYKYIGEKFYKDSCILDEKISCFESNIHSSYVHVKPLEMDQLENWHKYLDFAEKQEDFDWIVKLYERCLIPAAYYPEFWIRYVEFMENKGGRELANFALDRATRTFLKNIPVIHIYNSRYKEQIGDAFEARGALRQFTPNSDTNYVDNVIMKANMEKRLGNSMAASDLYKEAIDKAKSDEKMDLLPALYIHYSQHLYVTTKSNVTARDVLIDAIEQFPNCKLLYEELLKFVMMHRGREHIDVVDRVISTAFSLVSDESSFLSAQDLEHLSDLFLKYVDLCGTIFDVRKAWNRHMKTFPHLLRTKASEINSNGDSTHHHRHQSVDHAAEIPNTADSEKVTIVDGSKRSRENSPEKDIVQSEHELNPPSLAALSLDPTTRASGRPSGVGDEDSGQPCKTFAESNHHSTDEYRRHDTEPQPRWWNRTDNSGRHRRDSRFRFNGGHPRRRSQHQVQVHVQVQPDNPLGNPSSSSAQNGRNYNFAHQTQFAAQSSGEIVQNSSTEAYSLQMWQYYYYYYEQQQVAIQQQLQATQSQLQDREEQNPQVLQQISQLQQQQQQIYLLQQQLYQQYQQQQGLEQGLSQEQLLLYMQQQQQFYHQQFLQQSTEQTGQVQQQFSQDLQMQQHQPSGVETDKKEVEEIAAAQEVSSL